MEVWIFLLLAVAMILASSEGREAVIVTVAAVAVMAAEILGIAMFLAVVIGVVRVLGG